jgi:hypothetical protein
LIRPASASGPRGTGLLEIRKSSKIHWVRLKRFERIVLETKFKDKKRARQAAQNHFLIHIQPHQSLDLDGAVGGDALNRSTNIRSRK